MRRHPDVGHVGDVALDQIIANGGGLDDVATGYIAADGDIIRADLDATAGGLNAAGKLGFRLIGHGGNYRPNDFREQA